MACVNDVVVKYAAQGATNVLQVNQNIQSSLNDTSNEAMTQADKTAAAIQSHADRLSGLQTVVSGVWKSMVDNTPKLKEELGTIDSSFGKMAESLGKTLVPAVKVLADGMKVLADIFVGLPGPVRTIIAVGVALTTALLGLLSVAAMLAPAYAMLMNANLGLSLSFGTLAGTVSAALGPILLLVAAAGLLYLAWKNNLFGIQDKAKKAFAFIKGLFNKFVGFVKPFWDKFLGDALAGRWKEALKTILQFFLSAYAKWVKLWMSLGVKIGAAVAKLGAKIKTGIETALAKAVNGVKRQMNGIIGAFEHGFNKALGGLNDFISGIESGVNDAIRALNKLPEVDLGTVSLGQVGDISLKRLNASSNAEIEQRAKKRLEQRLSVIETRKQQGLSAIESAEQQIMPDFLKEGSDSSASSDGDTHNMTKVQLQPGAVQVQSSGDSEADMEYAAQKASQIIGQQVGSRGGVQ